MGVFSYFKNTVKANTNVRSWTSWNAVKENGKIVGDLIKDIKNPENDEIITTPLTFEQAMVKYGLTKADVQHEMNKHLILSLIFAVLGLAALVWTIFLLIKAMLLSSLVALSLSALMFSYAFQENFRYFQLKQHRLNCTAREWFFSFLPSRSNKKR